MLASHTAEMASGFGRKARDLLSEHGPSIFGVQVRGDSRAADRWEVAGHGGEMYSVGVGGAITGRGGDLMILDDYVKNAEEALSPTIRQKTWDWYTTTWLTRKQPGASEIIVATRWHEDDLIGRRLEDLAKSGEPHRVLRLPAIAEEHDELGRQPGEALWPDRYPIKRLETIRRTQSFWFNALYQGRPTPLGGTLFKAGWFKPYDWIGVAGPSFDGLAMRETGMRYMRNRCAVLMVVDPSLGQKNSDRVAIGVFCLSADMQRVFVLHMTSERIPLELIVPRIERLEQVWRPQAIHFEANGFQVQLARSAREVCTAPVVEIDPQGKSKLVRGIPAVELCSSGDLLIPDGEPWVTDYVDELARWTGSEGDRDDQVDVTAYAVRQLLEYRDSHCSAQPKAGPTKRMARHY